MKEFTFSKKDMSFIDEVFKTVIENYYQKSSQQRQAQIILLNNLIIETICDRKQINIDPIITKLEVLKIKSRSHQELKESINRTVQHLKNPVVNQLSQKTLQGCLKSNNLFQICCMIIERYWEKKIAKNIQKFDINKLFKLIYEGSKQHISIALQALMKILNKYPGITQQSGIIQAAGSILNIYLSNVIKDKNNVSQCLKILMKATQINKTISHNHEQIIGLVLYRHPSCILQVQSIANMSYEQQYCEKILNQPISLSKINLFFVWTNSSVFCSKITQAQFQAIQNLLRQQKIQQDLQYRIYKTLHNIISVNGSDVFSSWSFPKNMNEKVINCYLSLIKTVIYNSHHLSEQFNPVAIQKICMENKIDGEITKNLLIDIKKTLTESTNTIQITRSTFKRRTTLIQENTMDQLLSKAVKIPKNDKDIQDIDYVLSYQIKSMDQIQRDNLKLLKSRAIRSLKQALDNKQCPNFQKIYNSLNMKQYDNQTLKQMLEITNFQLKTNPSYINIIDMQHLAELILQVHNQNKNLLNFRALEEIFYLCSDTQNWSRQKNIDKTQQQWKNAIVQMLIQIICRPKYVKKTSKFQEAAQIVYNLSLNKYKQKQQQNKQPIQQLHQQQQKQQQQQQQQLQQLHQQTQQIIAKDQPQPQLSQKKQSQIQSQQKIQQPSQSQQIRSPQIINQSQETHSPQILNQPTQPQNNPASQQTQLINQYKQEQPQNNPTQAQTFAQEEKQTSTPIQNVNVNVNGNGNINVNYIPPEPSLRIKRFIKQRVKGWRKLASNSKQRFYKIREWLQTQKSYLEKLIVIRDHIRKPLLQNNFITQIDSIIIFSNLESMIQLCQMINIDLAKKFIEWHPINTELAPILQPLINCLKIYKEYSQRYNKSFATMNQLAARPNFNQYVKVVNLENYLFSPVQRFQKYHLFLSEYLRKLPKYHKDTEKLTSALNSLLKATDQINQFMQSQVKVNKMIELDRKFGNIVSTARQYKTSFQAICYQFKCRVYLLNDLLLVVKLIGDQEQLNYKIYLCAHSFVIRQPDCKSFRNRLYICGYEKSVHLNFQRPEESEKALNHINDCIQKIYSNQTKRLDIIMQSKSRMRMTVSTLNRFSNLKPTEQQQGINIYHPLQLSAEVVSIQKIVLDTQLKVYYVIKIQTTRPYQIRQYLFYQLKQLEQIQKILHNLYPDIKIPSFQIREKEINSQDVTKIGQHLCIAIQKFINYIIRNRSLSKKPELVLFKLGLHQSLWQFVNKNKSGITCLCNICQHAQIITDFSYYQKQKQLIRSRKHKFCVLNSFLTTHTISSLYNKNQSYKLKIQQMMVWARSKLKRIDYRLLQLKRFGKPLNIKVKVRMLSQDMLIQTKRATIFSTAREVIQQVCQIIGVQTTSDLALVYIYGKYENVLDDDQYLSDIQKFLDQVIKLKQKNSKNSIQQRNSFLALFTPLCIKENNVRVQLSLRKNYIFNQALEEQACMNNQQRFKLIAGEILQRYQQKILVLNGQDLKILCSSLYCMQNYSKLLNQNKKIYKQEIERYLPQSRRDLVKLQFLEKIQQIVRGYMQQIGKNGMAYVYKNMIKTFSGKTGCQTKYFQVQKPEKSALLGDLKNLLIGVTYKKVFITRQYGAYALLTYPISTFNYRIYGDSIYIETDEKTYRMTGSNLFALDTMIKTYRLIKEISD